MDIFGGDIHLLFKFYNRIIAKVGYKVRVNKTFLCFCLVLCVQFNSRDIIYTISFLLFHHRYSRVIIISIIITILV